LIGALADFCDPDWENQLPKAGPQQCQPVEAGALTQEKLGE
jgi:hypothetical protein